jgi:thymidylate synthase
MSNKLDEQYINLCKDILENGIEKETRNGKVLSVFGRTIRHNMREGFPLLTTKKMYFKGICTELLWFLQGRTDLRYLLERDCHIWDGDCYEAYKREQLKETEKILSKEEFINKIKTDDGFNKKWGDLGQIYGAQWRSYRYGTGIETSIPHPSESGEYIYEAAPIYIDQIKNLIDDILKTPDSRRLIVQNWNVADVYLNQTVLPACHIGFQIYTRELSYKERYDIWFKNNCKGEVEYDNTKSINFDDACWASTPKRAISLMFNMRSSDVPLGLPFNLASYGLLLEILAKIVNMVPDELIANLGDCHIYANQIKGIKEQLTRLPFELPLLEHMKTNEFFKSLRNDLSLLNCLDFTDFKIKSYQSHPIIKIPLSN